MGTIQLKKKKTKKLGSKGHGKSRHRQAVMNRKEGLIQSPGRCWRRPVKHEEQTTAGNSGREWIKRHLFMLLETPRGWQQWQLHESRNHIPWFSPSSFWQTEFFAVCFVLFFKPPPSLAVLLVQAVSMWSHSEEIWVQRQRECCLPDLEISTLSSVDLLALQKSCGADGRRTLLLMG